MSGAVLYGAKDLRIESRPIPSILAGQVLVRVRRAGICGSDLHYFEHGQCGSFIPTRPFILGHEFVGEVAALADGLKQPTVGSRVVINPARPCGFCSYCKAGRSNLCPKTIMLGSASTNPPTDGVFADFVAVRADQCHAVPVEMSDGVAALMEPLAVALHATKRAGVVSGRSVLVMGGGTIGLLVAITSRAFGATPVALSDPVAARRKSALALAADVVLDPTSSSIQSESKELAPDGFDVVFEASGAPPALRQAFALVRPGGTIVQIGTLGAQEVPLPANQLMVREIQLLGSFRYGDVFDEAIRLTVAGWLKLESLISCVLPLSQAARAIQQAFAKAEVIKVQLEIH